MLVRAPVDDIVAGLTDGYSYRYQDRQHQHQHGNAGRVRFQRRNPRGQDAPTVAVEAPAIAAVNAVAGGGERRCYNCNQPGHLREDCDKLHPEVREYLKQQAARGRGRGRGRSRGGAEGQGLLPSVRLMCNIWWIDSQVSLLSSYLTSGW